LKIIATLLLNKSTRSYYKVSQIFLVDHFLYGFIITAAGAERMHLASSSCLVIIRMH